jgi:glucose-1-phosphate cytidylyltransferase
MKVVLFCGGLGTRIREYNSNIPKPMVPIGNQPIIWHIMKYYSHYGHSDFILCLGYKANIIREYFLNHKPALEINNVAFNFDDKSHFLSEQLPTWRVALIDTGLSCNVGQRLSAVKNHLQGEEIFLANYSDGLTDAPLPDMIEYFKESGKIACFIAVHPPFNFHLAEFGEDGLVRGIRPSTEANVWINGGYFIFRRQIFDYIYEGDELVDQPFNRLIQEGQLITYKYKGFWRAMDTLMDRHVLEEMVERGEMPWQPSFKRELLKNKT